MFNLSLIGDTRGIKLAELFTVCSPGEGGTYFDDLSLSEGQFFLCSVRVG